MDLIIIFLSLRLEQSASLVVARICLYYDIDTHCMVVISRLLRAILLR